MSTSLVCWIGSTRNWIGGISGSICTEYSKTQRVGRPSYPPVVLFKVLLLQQWYGLSNPMAEEAIGDRLSFRRFLGFGLMENSCRDPRLTKNARRKKFHEGFTGQRIDAEPNRGSATAGPGMVVEASQEEVTQFPTLPMTREFWLYRGAPDALFAHGLFLWFVGQENRSKPLLPCLPIPTNEAGARRNFHVETLASSPVLDFRDRMHPQNPPCVRFTLTQQ